VFGLPQPQIFAHLSGSKPECKQYFGHAGAPEPHFFLAFEKKEPYSEKKSTEKVFSEGGEKGG
jgi:hypothetical protein